MIIRVSVDPALSHRAARACVIAGLVAVLVFVAWQYLMPASFDSVRGLNPRAIAEWRARVGLGPPGGAIALGLYAALFRTWIVVAWVSYAALLWLIYRGARPGGAGMVRLVIGVVAVVAVAMPPGLSTDVFAYVGYARLAVVHGLNPHVATQVDLVRLGDPTAPYLHWPIASPYGPLWTMVSIAVVALAPAGAVIGPVLALKMIAGAALVATAWAARRLVRRLDPARADAAFIAVAANPLLLVEGPGSGHNDLVMAALLLLGFAAWFGAPARPRAAALAIGAAAAVKLIPLLALPWLAIAAARAAAPGARSRVAVVAAVAALGVGPVVLAYAPFWAGGRALGGLAQRWRHADGAAASEHGAGPSGGPAQGAPASAEAGGSGGGKHGSPASAAKGAASARASSGATAARGSASVAPSPFSEVARRTWPGAVVYLLASALLFFRRPRADPGADADALTAWVYVALAVMLFVAGLWFPWYLAWAWPALSLRWNRHHLALSAFVLSFSLLLMLAYAMAPS